MVRRKDAPTYADLASFRRIVIWTDARGGASALVGTASGELVREDLERIFLIARSNEAVVSLMCPLMVYGLRTRLSETETFRFVQVDREQRTALWDAAWRGG